MSLTLLRGRRAVATLLLVGASVAVAPAALAADAGPDLSGGCTDPDGVTVVVDLTELDGTVEIGCASSAATGTEALETAGFTPTKDAAGMICAIDAAPDPCPTTFTGQYWSYWTATPDGDWQMAMEGSDTAVPTPGALEGWRYGDGSAAPGATPADVIAAASADEGPDAAAPSPEVTAAAVAVTEAGNDAGGLPVWVPVTVGVAVLVAAAGAVVVVRRRGADGFGPASQD